MKKTYLLTIETDDENIAEKYPNWRFNHPSPTQFIKWLAKSKEEISYIDTRGKRQSMWGLFGYRVTVKESK
jgi:hypothetical protein